MPAPIKKLQILRFKGNCPCQCGPDRLKVPSQRDPQLDFIQKASMVATVKVYKRSNWPLAHSSHYQARLISILQTAFLLFDNNLEITS